MIPIQPHGFSDFASSLTLGLALGVGMAREVAPEYRPPQAWCQDACQTVEDLGEVDDIDPFEWPESPHA